MKDEEAKKLVTKIYTMGVRDALENVKSQVHGILDKYFDQLLEAIDKEQKK